MPAFKNFLSSSACRATEPEEEDNMQRCCECVPDERQIVGVFVSRVIMDAENTHIAYRASCFSGVTNVQQEARCKDETYQEKCNRLFQLQVEPDSNNEKQDTAEA